MQQMIDDRRAISTKKNTNFGTKARHIWRKFFKSDDGSLRETLEELIEEGDEIEPSIESNERQLIGNVLNLRDLTAQDVMVPRTDIVAVSHNITPLEIMAAMTRTGLSQILVYKDNLDEIIGVIHVKDMLAWSQSKSGAPFKIRPMLREVLFISPSMRTLDLLLQMRQSGTKISLVVDEYGGIDGLVTFSNLIEEIIGDIQNAHDQIAPMTFQRTPEGNILVDARYYLEDIESHMKLPLSMDSDTDDVDTIGGLVTLLAGHVPSPGELIRHPTGCEFEVVDADPRRIKTILIHPTGRKKTSPALMAPDNQTA